MESHTRLVEGKKVTEIFQEYGYKTAMKKMNIRRFFKVEGQKGQIRYRPYTWEFEEYPDRIDGKPIRSLTFLGSLADAFGLKLRQAYFG